MCFTVGYFFERGMLYIYIYIFILVLLGDVLFPFVRSFVAIDSRFHQPIVRSFFVGGVIFSLFFYFLTSISPLVEPWLLVPCDVSNLSTKTPASSYEMSYH